MINVNRTINQRDQSMGCSEVTPLFLFVCGHAMILLVQMREGFRYLAIAVGVLLSQVF